MKAKYLVLTFLIAMTVLFVACGKETSEVPEASDDLLLATNMAGNETSSEDCNALTEAGLSNVVLFNDWVLDFAGTVMRAREAINDIHLLHDPVRYLLQHRSRYTMGIHRHTVRSICPDHNIHNCCKTQRNIQTLHRLLGQISASKRTWRKPSVCVV